MRQIDTNSIGNVAGFTWLDIFHFGGLVFFWVLPNGKTQSESTSHAMQQSCPCTSLSRPHRLVAIKWITQPPHHTKPPPFRGVYYDYDIFALD